MKHMSEEEWTACFKRHQRKAKLYWALACLILVSAFVTICIGITAISAFESIFLQIISLPMLLIGTIPSWLVAEKLGEKARDEDGQGHYHLVGHFYVPMDEEKEETRLY